MAARIEQARRLRKASTPAERLLWSKLRNGQLYGFRFRRQHVLGNRIVDFFCAEAQLAIELDGSGHAQTARRLAEIARTIDIEGFGVRSSDFETTR